MFWLLYRDRSTGNGSRRIGKFGKHYGGNALEDPRGDVHEATGLGVRSRHGPEFEPAVVDPAVDQCGLVAKSGGSAAETSLDQFLGSYCCLDYRIPCLRRAI